MTCRTIAVANQKGGTAKTATALGLGGSRSTGREAGCFSSTPIPRET